MTSPLSLLLWLSLVAIGGFGFQFFPESDWIGQPITEEEVRKFLGGDGLDNTFSSKGIILLLFEILILDKILDSIDWI